MCWPAHASECCQYSYYRKTLHSHPAFPRTLSLSLFLSLSLARSLLLSVTLSDFNFNSLSLSLSLSLSRYECLVACLTQCTVNYFNSNLWKGLEVLSPPFCCSSFPGRPLRDGGRLVSASPEAMRPAPGHADRIGPRWKCTFVDFFSLFLS